MLEFLACRLHLDFKFMPRFNCIENIQALLVFRPCSGDLMKRSIQLALHEQNYTAISGYQGSLKKREHQF